MLLKQHSENTHVLRNRTKGRWGSPRSLRLRNLRASHADAAAAKLEGYGNLTLEAPRITKESFKFRDPDGFLVQLNGLDLCRTRWRLIHESANTRISQDEFEGSLNGAPCSIEATG